MNTPKYPRRVPAVDCVNSYFSPGLYSLPGGRVKYDSVVMTDGGSALYLSRAETTHGLHIVRRWIPWDTEIIQHYATDDEEE